MAMIRACFISLLFLLALTIPVESQNVYFKGLNQEAYSSFGDINLGAFQSVYMSSSDTFGLCSTKLYQPYTALLFMEAIAYGVQIVNKDPNILPNVTLGFVVLDSCRSQKAVLAQALSFLPTVGNKDGSCEAGVCTSTDSSGQESSAHLSTNSSSVLTAESSMMEKQPVKHYDVVGLLGPTSSERSVSVSLLMSAANVPVVGYRSTSVELSNKSLYPNFLRTVSSDYFQVLAMLNFISRMGWSYISVVYQASFYGETAYDNIKAISAETDICIALSHKVADNTDLREVAEELLSVPEARVVILFIYGYIARDLFQVIRDLNATGHFVWVCSSAVRSYTTTFTEHVDDVSGAFFFSHYSIEVPAFYDYIQDLSPASSKNPWYNLTWEEAFDCSLKNGTCDLDRDIRDLELFTNDKVHASILDSVLTFAHGLDSLLSEKCPGASGRSARYCVSGEDLIHYLRKADFEGFTGRIRFDDNGDLLGKLIIEQIVPETDSDGTRNLRMNEIGFYDIPSRTTSYQKELLRWQYFKKVDRIIPLNQGDTSDIPEAVCSRPCKVNEYKILKKLVCCWECRPCRANEKLVNERTKCEACPMFTWPDPGTGLTTCEDIPPSFPKLTDSLTIFQLSLSIIALLAITSILCLYIKHRQARAIKAASRELSFLQLAGISLGYTTVIFLQLTPSDHLCVAIYFMFCLSLTWLYAPLLIKAIRIYRIFCNGRAFNRRPKFTRPKSQILFSVSLILLQTAMCIIVTIVDKPQTILTHPKITERLVELSCHMPVSGLASFLAFNLVLVILSSVFAFMTRDLPDKFKESKFISLCVFTTLLIWLAYIPSYFTAANAMVRVLLLSMALILNNTVAIFFLFVPNLYAAIFLPEMEFAFGRVRAHDMSKIAAPRTEHDSIIYTNRVSPATEPISVIEFRNNTTYMPGTSCKSV